MNQPTTLAIVCFLAACGPLPVDAVDETGEDDVATSIFRNNLRRVNLQPQASAQSSIDVRNEDELFAALTSLPTTTATGDCSGRAINLVADITLTRTISLDDQHAGLLITSASRSRVTSSSVISMITVVGDNVDSVAIKGISAVGFVALLNLAGKIVERWSIFNVVGDGTFSAGAIATSGGRLGFSSVRDSYVDGVSGDCNFTSFIGNDMTSMSLGNTVNAIISGNIISGNITLTAAGGSLTIMGNGFLGGASIDTSAGPGANTIFGNTNVGTITTHATDAVGLNT